MRNAGLCIASHTHRGMPVQLDLFTSEETVDLLQSEVAWLWVEEVDKREKTEVED